MDKTDDGHNYCHGDDCHDGGERIAKSVAFAVPETDYSPKCTGCEKICDDCEVGVCRECHKTTIVALAHVADENEVLRQLVTKWRNQALLLSEQLHGRGVTH